MVYDDRCYITVFYHCYRTPVGFFHKFVPLVYIRLSPAVPWLRLHRIRTQLEVRRNGTHCTAPTHESRMLEPPLQSRATRSAPNACAFVFHRLTGVLIRALFSRVLVRVEILCSLLRRVRAVCTNFVKT